MADNSEDILKQLQQFELEPPAGAFEKALHALHLDSPPSDLLAEQREKILFSQLQEFSVTPPAVDLVSVMKNGQVQQLKNNPGKKWWRVAAAVIIIALSLVIYKSTTRPSSSGNNISSLSPASPQKEMTANSSSKKDSSTETVSAGNTTKSGSDRPADIYSSRIKKSAAGSKAIKSSGQGLALSRNQHKAGETRLYNNDVFLTLVNYQLPGWQQFFNKSVSEKKVTLNQYSYHNLSDKMVEMLQEVYFVKRNGKPSRKAKKAKRRFEKWRKKDETFFDKTLQRNPVDIIDLSEFLQKNK